MDLAAVSPVEQQGAIADFRREAAADGILHKRAWRPALAGGAPGASALIDREAKIQMGQVVVELL